jgi:phage tail sheath protein FI
MAIYHPWVGGPKNANTARPPSGVAAGIYARIDQAHGVWKAPAGQAATAMGVTTLVQTVTPADAEMLRSAGINAIRKIAGAGIVLWGAGTFAAASENDWKYVNIRRFLLFLERSIEEGLSWAVFEPNGETLWAEIRLEISAFLHTAWRAGALQGVTPKDAYFVRCDATTMTQDDIDNGRVIASIGVAPLKPAEFVIIRIGIRCN